MFYCDECAKPRGWPETIFRSEGPCEICGESRLCNDTPSRHLPIPPAPLLAEGDDTEGA